MMVFLTINIIVYYPATYLKENQQNFQILKEEQKSPQVELYDLNTILLFDENIWCLNVSKNCVMVFSKEGIFKRVFFLPGIKDKGVSQMYVYHNQLCVRDKHNTLYQFASVDDYKTVFLKDGIEVQAFDKSGDMIDKVKLNKQYDEVLLSLDGQYYLDRKESDEILIYEKAGEKRKEIIDYEKLTNSSGNRQDTVEGTIYRIGGINNKIIKVEDGKELILRKSGVAELLFLSADMHLMMIVLLVLMQLARYILQRILENTMIRK